MPHPPHQMTSLPTPSYLPVFFPGDKASHTHSHQSIHRRREGAPHHPAEDRDELCHSVPRAVPAPSSHPVVPAAQVQGLQLFPWESIPVGCSPGTRGCQQSHRGYRTPGLATAVQLRLLDTRRGMRRGCWSQDLQGMAAKGREASLQNRAAGRETLGSPAAGLKNGTGPSSRCPSGTWGCRGPAAAQGGFAPQHIRFPGNRGEGKCGGERWLVCTGESSAGRQGGLNVCLPGRRGLLTRSFTPLCLSFPSHQQGSTAEGLHELAACLQFQRWQNSDVLRQLTGWAALSPSAGSDQKLLQPGSPEQPQGTHPPPYP